MNIIDIQDQLKNFSEQQLVSEMQSPTGSAPQFLVLSEIKRRKRVRDDFAKREAAQQPTVAQEAVASAGVPQSGIAGMAEAMAPRSVDAQQNMRSGGLMQFGAEIQRGLAEKVQNEQIDPFLDEVEQMAQTEFGVDSASFGPSMRPMPTNIRPMTPSAGLASLSPFGATKTGGKGGAMLGMNRMATLRAQSNPVTETQVMPSPVQKYDEGGVVRAANGLPLGLRQNNPGNIRPGAGFIGETGQGSGYAQFGSEEEGLRALARLLGTYSDEYGINTLRGLTSRYAPRSDNEASFDNYVSYLGEQLGMDPDEEFDLKSRRDELIPAIVGFEQGRDFGDRYSQGQISRAIEAAGTDDPEEVARILGGSDEPGIISKIVSAINPISTAQASEVPSEPASLYERRSPGRGATPTENVPEAAAFSGYPSQKGITPPLAGLAERKSGMLDMIRSLTNPIAATNFYGQYKQEIDADPDLKAAINAIINPSSLAVATLENFEAQDEVVLPNNTVIDEGETIPAGTVMSNKQAEDLGVAAEGTGGTVGSIDEGDSDFTSMYPFVPPGLLDDNNVPVLPKSAEVQQAEVEAAGAALPETDGSGSDSGEENQTDGDPAAIERGEGEGEGEPNVTFSDRSGSAEASSSLQQEILDLQKRLEKDRDTDKYLALAQAGLALMSSTNPTLLGAVGEAGVSGLSAYREAQDRYNEGVVDLINARSKLAKGSDKDAFDASNAVTRLNAIDRALDGSDATIALDPERKAKLLNERLVLARFLEDQGLPGFATGSRSASAPPAS